MRKRFLKKIAVMGIAGILSCTLVSCKDSNSGVQIVESLQSEPEYISFFAANSMSNSDIGKYWSDRFAQMYNQQVYVNYDGATYYAEEGLSYRELLEKRLESTSPDELYIINAEDVLEFGAKGYWMDLSGLDFVDNLSEAALYQSTYDGKVFSVPLTFTGFGFCWNLTMLEEYGLSVPENLEDFLEVCEQLKSNGILPYGANRGYALTVPIMCKGLADLYGSPDQDQHIAKLNSGEVAISSYVSDGFSFLTMMIEKGYLDPQQAMNAEPRKEDIALFQNGQCAFVCMDLGASMQQMGESNFQMVFTGLPLLENGCIAVYGANSRLCVNPNSNHIDTALKFIEMVGTQEALDESAEWQKMMSSAKNSKIVVSSQQQKMVELLQQPGQIPNQDFALHFNTWENIRDRGREICEGASVEEACSNLDELQRAELEAYSDGR